MLLLLRRYFVLYEDRINVNLPSLAIYSTDLIKTWSCGTFGGIRKLAFHLGYVPLFDWCVSPSSRFVRS